MEDEIDFDKVDIDSNEEQEMGVEDFSIGNFIKNPKVGEAVEFKVEKIINSKKTTAINKETNKEFNIGLKEKSGRIRRIDIHTDKKEIYTIGTWEIYFKLFGKDGLLIDYAKKHNNSFKGATIVIKKLLDGGHANLKADELMKILGKTLEETKKYQENIKVEIKESKLYEVQVK